MKRIALPLACAALGACASLAPGYTDLALENLFNVEREFAHDAYTHGIRPAFLQHFAVDAIVFAPGPVRYAEQVRNHPAPADPRAVLLEWGPQSGAVSRAADLGFTTGPTRAVKRTDPQGAANYGYYFSVWSRIGGEWKVIVDAGVSQSSPPPQQGVANMRTAIFHKPDIALTDAQRAANREQLLAMERLPRAIGAAPPGARAYVDLITPATLLLRSDEPMLTGNELAHYIRAVPSAYIAWTPIDGAIADSNDLAYTYGTSRRSGSGEATLDGYYVHVWQRDRDLMWKLIADVWLPSN